jgi:putative iron-regulated protein
MTRWLPRFYLTLVLSTVACFAAYGQDQAAKPVTPQAVLAHYATLVHASYEDAYTRALALQSALKTLVETPLAAALESAKAAWKAARMPYGQTEVYRFYGGPIDDADGPEGFLNAWPLDESYIDYVDGNAHTGIINSTELPITADRLRSLNEHNGEENISTGFHAIEFLLWGQDQRTDGPGSRPYTDYVAPNDSPGSPPRRRGQYVLSLAEMLVRDLKGLVDAWAPDHPDNYRAAFLQVQPSEVLRRILVGIGTLSQGELAGERMTVALATRDQEDEHSCFSDNTHVDIVQNARGIQNVYQGRYVRTNGVVVEGPGLDALISPKLRAAMDQQLAATLDKVQAIVPPFDREITTEDGRQRVQNAIASLRLQARLIVAMAKELGMANLQVERPQ